MVAHTSISTENVFSKDAIFASCTIQW